MSNCDSKNRLNSFGELQNIYLPDMISMLENSNLGSERIHKRNFSPQKTQNALTKSDLISRSHQNSQIIDTSHKWWNYYN